MARDLDQIQADIALTRRLIEGHLDKIARKVPRRWWTPYAIVAGGLVVGFVLSRVPALRLISTSARTVQTGLTVAGTVGAIDRFIADHRPARAA